MTQQIPLAIVIPAFKAEFLRETLQSIAAQTNKNFRVYVGDDASPEPIEQIVREFSGLPIKYTRFEKNMGRNSLIKHWERCIRMSDEPWVWLFSDDDVMDVDCVEKFYQELKLTDSRYDLYRFNTNSIGAAGDKLYENATHPQNESGPDFLVARLRGHRTSTAQELVFSREAWRAIGGFPDFPLAWAADDAFAAELGALKPLRVISGPRVSWRLSGRNISTNNNRVNAVKKIQACREFVEWAANFFQKFPPSDRHLANGELAALFEEWFFLQMLYTRKIVNLKTCLEIDGFASASLHRQRGYGFFKTLKQNYRLAREKIFDS